MQRKTRAVFERARLRRDIEAMWLGVYLRVSD
jgi:hypothetical protein